jgi:hypothetical protein
MKSIVIAFAIALATAACAQTSTQPETNTDQAMLQPSQYGQLVGRWKFVYTPERRAAVEAKLAEKFADPADLAKAKQEAVDESDASEIEFTADRVYVSRIGKEEILRAKIDMTPKDVAISLRDPNTLVMHDPQKGDLVFTRVR